MKKNLPIFLPLLLSLTLLIILTSCTPPTPSPYIDCDIGSLVDAIDAANANPDVSTIDLNPGCTYMVDQRYADLETGLPHITTEVIINGNGATITRPDRTVQTSRYRLLYVTTSGDLTISDITLSNGYIYGPNGTLTNSSGAGILSKGQVAISEVIFEGNSATFGGGLALDGYSAGGIVSNSTFRNNEAGFRGGAINNGAYLGLTIEGVLFEGNESPGSLYLSTGSGGAVSNWRNITILNSTFSGNYARNGAGAIISYNPAAVALIDGCVFYGNESRYSTSVISNNGISVSILNSTISANTSTNGANAIYNESGRLSISYSTITGNHGNGPALGSDNNDVEITNSIIVGNSSGNCSPSLQPTIVGSSIDSDGSCSGFITTDPLLEPLADNGGGTLTHALDPNSPAINLASGSCPAADQRGVSRPYGNACDIGAYESEVGTSVCDVQFLIDAINDANANPDPTTIELTPGCIYVLNEAYPGGGSDFQEATGLPLVSTEITILGNGAVITRPAPSEVQDRFRLLGVMETGNLSLSNLSLINGYLSGFFGAPYHVSESGGAIYNNGVLSLSDIGFEGNKGRSGGAVCNSSQGVMTISSSEFENNRGFNYGGAIYNSGEASIMDSLFEANFTGSINLAASHGGAVYNLGDMEIFSSSFIDNEADNYGGAIFNRLPSSSLSITGSLFYGNESNRSSVLDNEEGHVSLLNTTISHNTSNGDWNAIHNNAGVLEISFSTISQNWGGGPTISSDNTNVTINNSIIAMNYGPGDCSFPGPINATGNNLGWGSSCPEFSLNADPIFSGLSFHGGSTKSYSLAPDSPAIDQALGDCPAVDQRGVTRPHSFACDLGAYEAEEVEACSINYLVNAIHFANSNPDPTTIELDPGCTYVVDQQYGDRQSGLPGLLTDITILGNGATITRPGLAQQPDEYRLFYVEYRVPVSISDLTLSSGIITGAEGINADSDSHGGAIFNRGDLSLMRVTLQENQALSGGAVANSSRGSLDIDDSIFNENYAALDGGALYLAGSGGVSITGSLFDKNEADGEVAGGYAGAIYNQYDLSLTNSTLTGNDSRRGGGGVYNRGEANVVACTLTGNSAIQAGGSALENQSGTMIILNSTVSGNQAGPGDLYQIFNGGGLVRITFSTVTAAEGGAAALGSTGSRDSYRFDVSNSIIANNPPGDCDPSLSLNVFGNNLDSDGSCQGFSLTGDPFLLPLADNGGGTWTHALQIDSPALNAAAGECPISDQRGVSRPEGTACDLGAYEYDGLQPTPSPTPEIDPCIFEALRNSNCRASDCATADFIASLPMGQSALLIGLNPLGTHGLFELQTGEECWMVLSLLTGGDSTVCNPIIAVPPPCPTPSGITCTADLGEEVCEKAGGIYHPGFAAAPWCECP